MAGKLFVIGAAQPGRLDPKQPVLGADFGNIEIAIFEFTRLGEHRRMRLFGHGPSPP